MKKFFIKATVVGFSLLMALNVSAQTAASDLRDQLRKGVDLLYKDQTPSPGCTPSVDCADSVDKEAVVDDAIALKKQYDDIIQNYHLTDLQMTQVDVAGTIFKFQFSSPIQKPNAKSNIVYGYLYRPNLPAGCDNKFPGTVLVHHVDQSISSEQSMAKYAAGLYQGVIAVIYLPNYGPRRENQNAAFFPAEASEFKSDLLQSLVDLRITGEIVAQDPLVDRSKMQIGGLSLGAILSVTSAGMESFFKTYFIGLGGGDLGGILTSDKKTLSGVTKTALQSVNWNPDEARRQLAPFDPLVWAYTVKNKNFILIEAKEDEIIHHEMSFEKLHRAYQETGANSLKYFEHAGHHVPDWHQIGFGKFIEAYYQVLSKAVMFFGPSQAGEVHSCDLYRN